MSRRRFLNSWMLRSLVKSSVGCWVGCSRRWTGHVGTTTMSDSVLGIDQRWLLLHMGGWPIVAALCSPEGVSALMRSRWGSTSGHAADLDGSPEWLKQCGFETSAGTIFARARKLPGLKIKAADINRFAAQIPKSIKDELLECRNAGTANAVLRGRFCHCGDHARSYPYQKDAICPPTVEQENEAKAEYWRIRAWEHVVLAKALGLSRHNWIDGVEQLELFGAIV